jgi:DNA-binding NtrC family response regulator
MVDQAEANSEGHDVLVVEQDPKDAYHLIRFLQDAGRRPKLENEEDLLVQACTDPALKVVLLDDTARRGFRHNLLAHLKRDRPDVDVILMVRRGDVASVVEGMRLGAADCLVKPVEEQQLGQSMASMQEARALENEIDALRGRLENERGLERILGTSLGMRRAVEMVRRVASYPVSVLILGESGTGKELFAEALHHLSGRSQGPFVAVDCGAIPAELVEAELFGHVRGAFTGAQEGRPGRLEEANGGTLFLDEIGNLPAPTQMKLLRVLQERIVYRLGARESVPLDVRLVTATNNNLRDSIRQGTFREDLYHRIAEFTIQLPTLRERGDDIELLSRYFLHRYNRSFRRDVKGFSDEAMAKLKAHRWPGNVRELQSAIKRAVILAGGTIQAEHLPADLGGPVTALPAKPAPVVLASYHLPDGVVPLWAVGQSVAEEVEKKAIEEALARTSWDKSKAAELLDIHFKTLYRKIKEYQIG